MLIVPCVAEFSLQLKPPDHNEGGSNAAADFTFFFFSHRGIEICVCKQECLGPSDVGNVCVAGHESRLGLLLLSRTHTRSTRHNILLLL